MSVKWEYGTPMMTNTKLTPGAIKSLLVNALTEYDRKQSSKRDYNPHALALYFQALDDAMEQYRHGATLESALRYSFNDRVLTVCLKAMLLK